MAWKFLDEVLVEHCLTQLPLSMLEPDCAEFDVLLYQHGGGIVANNDGVSNLDAELATAKFKSLFDLAEKVRPHLLVTPEYSCPWSVVEQETQGDRWPVTGTAWIVGCESIHLSELQQLADRCTNAIWLLPRCAPERDQVFLDCVCILMTARDAHRKEVRVLAIQAKGCGMADSCHLIEPKSLILGTDRFVIRNDPDSIHLAVFVCSDSLEHGILTSLPHEENFPYIIIHTQLNPDPRNLSFREYRDFWGTHNRERIEILCLNWAKGTTILGVPTDFGGSGWYYKSNAVDANDADVNGTHSVGAYYTENNKRYFHCHLLNYSEYIFHLRSRKISQIRSAPPTHLPRKGPSGVAAYTWGSNTLSWMTDSPDDGFADACQLIGDDLSPLTDPAMSPANKERLACLSSGEIARSCKAKWPSLRALPSFEMTSDEICHRITFCHDPDAQSRETRRRRLQAFSALKNEILSRTVPFPPHLELLQTRGGIRYPVDNRSLSFNVAGPNGEFPATFVFLGDATEAHAKKRMADLADIIGEAKRTLVVWFRENGQLHYAYLEGLNDFTADLNESVRSIVGEAHV